MRRPVEFGAPSPVDDLPGDLERRVAARVGISAPEPDRVRFEGFDIFGAELQAWRLTRRIKLGTPAGHRGSFQSLAARVSSAPDQVAPLATRPQIVVSIWHAGDDTDQAIRIESIECADGGEAQRRLLRATADIENPNIELWERDTPGESSLRLPDGALALFTRGNHLHILRSVGRRALDVTAEAEGLDDWLMRSGEPEGQAGSVAAFVPAWTRLEMVARSEGARNFSRYVVTPVSRRH
jgi:hypothetical protein